LLLLVLPVELLFQNDESDMSKLCLIARDKMLRRKLEELVVEKKERLSTLQELRRREKRLCTTLGLSASADSIVLRTVPSYEELHQLSDYITDLETKKVP